MTLTNLDRGAAFLGYALPPERNRENEESIEIVASDVQSIQDELTKAVEALQENAPADEGRGILVTRHTLVSFTVSLSWAVPRRTIYEQDFSDDLTSNVRRDRPSDADCSRSASPALRSSVFHDGSKNDQQRPC
jgi:hypothetical protein